MTFLEQDLEAHKLMAKELGYTVGETVDLDPEVIGLGPKDPNAAVGKFRVVSIVQDCITIESLDE